LCEVVSVPSSVVSAATSATCALTSVTIAIVCAEVYPYCFRGSLTPRNLAAAAGGANVGQPGPLEGPFPR
jgi:hypothetical protein